MFANISVSVVQLLLRVQFYLSVSPPLLRVMPSARKWTFRNCWITFSYGLDDFVVTWPTASRHWM